MTNPLNRANLQHQHAALHSLSLSLLFYPSKCQIQARLADPGLPRNAMFPVSLCFTFHNQQTARCQCQVKASNIFSILVPQHKASFPAEAERGNHRLLAEFGFIITVHTHAIVLIAVVVNQYTIECLCARRFNTTGDFIATC